MNSCWKLEDGKFFICHSDKWDLVFAEDIYCSAFGGAPSESSLLLSEDQSIKKAFPNIRFSKFSVSPELELKLDGNDIKAVAFFEKMGKTYPIPLPTKQGVNYAIADNTWYYFSGEYDQIVDVLERSEASSTDITFKQFVAILNNAQLYPGLHINDQVSSCFSDDKIMADEYQPVELKATLYPYQKVGYKWLKFITDGDCGCVLGDEMGLGKTLQVISVFVDRNKKAVSPSLVVAPLSLLENWKREINRFAPALKVCVHHGAKRTGRYADLMSYDVVVTSYGTIITDLSLFEMIKWDLLILDEAQNIKNPEAIRTMSVKQIPHRAAIAVTGTPFENHMTDIWSILDFSIPGCLGTLREYNAKYSDDIYGAEKIEPILSALMLRRKVDDVAKDLPDKIVIPQPLVMQNAEALRYEDTRRDIIASHNMQAATLALLSKLRMFCTHPFLVDSSIISKNPVKYSTKYERFCEIVEEIVEQEEKVIVFTSFSDMFAIMENDISYRFNIPVDCINGSTPPSQRQDIVDRFNNHVGPSMLILNPRAAGTGLNITGANHVIHYNLEWNPALEDQATARSYRRGQEKTVFVYRLYYVDTVEEVVNDKIMNKRIMSYAAVIGSEGTENTRSLILQALGKSPLKEA